MKVKVNKLLLDKKNKDILIKVHRGIKLNKTEIKRLARTQRIIGKAQKQVAENEKYQNKINDLFF